MEGWDKGRGTSCARGREGRWRAVPGEVVDSLSPISLSALLEAGGSKHTEDHAGLKQCQVKINIAAAKGVLEL